MSEIIKTVNLCKYYKMGDNIVKALHNVSFSVGSGEFLAIIGQSGSGKSTLMNILGCLDKPDSGDYYLNQQVISSYNEGQLAGLRNRYIGFVFQNFNLLPFMTARDNVALPLIYAGCRNKEREARATIALQQVGMAERMHHRPSQLSGGQCQRVAIARALVTNPSLLLADEPTGNLDSGSGQAIMDIFRQLHSEGKTIILITHEAKVAEQTKRIIKIGDGMVNGDQYVV